MTFVSIPFDERAAYEIAGRVTCPLELTLPEILDESIWERLCVIKELVYPLPLIVAFSPFWLEVGLEEILTRLAVSHITGISLKNSPYTPFLTQINQTHHLGLSLIQ